MGWSCGWEAGETLEAVSKACGEQTGSSNVYEAGGAYFMYEVSRKEHNDGAITGSVLKFEGNPLGAPSCRARKAGTFRIEGNGRVSRGPAIMKKVGAAREAAYEAAVAKEEAAQAAAKKLFAQGAMFVVVE